MTPRRCHRLNGVGVQGAGPRVWGLGFSQSSVGVECWFHRNVQRFRGGLVFKAHRLLCHSILGLRVIQKIEEVLARHHPRSAGGNGKLCLINPVSHNALLIRCPTSSCRLINLVSHFKLCLVNLVSHRRGDVWSGNDQPTRR